VYQIDQLLLADPSKVHGRTFYLGDHPAMNIANWADHIASVFGVSKPTRVPFLMLSLLAKLGDWSLRLGIRFPMTTFRLKNMTTDNVVDLKPIMSVAGASPIDTEEATRRTVQWLRSMSSLTSGT
jgi:hypothetical protein